MSVVFFRFLVEKCIQNKNCIKRVSIEDGNAFMDCKISCSCPTFDFTIVHIKHHPVKVMDLEIQAQCLWGPYDVALQVMDFETPCLSTSYSLHDLEQAF